MGNFPIVNRRKLSYDVSTSARCETVIRLDNDIGVGYYGNGRVCHQRVRLLQSLECRDWTRDTVMGGGGWNTYEWNSLTRRTKLRNVNFGAPTNSKNYLGLQFPNSLFNRPYIPHCGRSHNKVANVHSLVTKQIDDPSTCNALGVCPRHHKRRFRKAQPLANIAHKRERIISNNNFSRKLHAM